MVKKKYRALRAIAFILQVLAWVVLVLTLLGAIGAVGAGVTGLVTIPALDTFPQLDAAAGLVAGIASGLSILIVGILNFIVLLAASDFLYLQIDVEQNTRHTAEYMRQLLATQQPVSVEAPTTPVLAEPYSTGPTVTVPSTPPAQ